MAKAFLEWSHGKPRPIIRSDEGETPFASAEAAPINDEKTGRFLPGNRAHRRRQLKARSDGLSTINPATAPTWMRPYIELGATYTKALLTMLQERPALFPLAGATADAHALYRAHVALALATADTKERGQLMTEARGWLREHRSNLATLAALAGSIAIPTPPDVPWLEADTK